MSNDGLILGAILEAAVRSLLLGAGVLALLKLTRLRDLRAETSIWTVVLVAGLAMPLASLFLPGRIVVPLPRIDAMATVFGRPSAAAVAPLPATAAPAMGPVGVEHAAARASHIGHWLLAIYGIVALAGLIRLALGVALTWRLYLRARPIDAEWAQGRDIRASAAIHGPLCFARSILLPADYQDWSPAKRLAVLAHEECHVRRGDFFIQLLASAHRAVFWFSPFAWWLPHRLGELAESASDEAAMQRIDDPAGYAEILLEVSRRARAMPDVVAMAHGPGVAKRVDRILSGKPGRSLSAVSQFAAVGTVLVMCLAFARVYAVTPQAQSTHAPQRGAASHSPDTHPLAANALHLRRASVHVRARPQIERVAAAPANPAPDFTYNPRALLEQPDAAVVSAIVLGNTRARQTLEEAP